MHKLNIVYKIPTGRRGRPELFTKSVKLPVRRGPITGRINEALDKYLPVKADLVKAELVA